MSGSIPYLFRGHRHAPEERGGRPPQQRTERLPGMVIERDVAVAASSGAVIRVDVYRPDGAEPAAPLVSWSPYGKHITEQLGVVRPTSGVQAGYTSELTTFEAPDPAYWVPHGYAVVVADIPGTWYSEGAATYCSPEEARDFYDLIEWAGGQEWSNGRVGLSGVSYLTVSQWRVAELNPPHLAAINPWEGWTDTYREVARHGGIPETWFWPYIWERWGYATGPIEDLEAETAAHPFYDAFWESKSADLEKVTVPAFVVASWSDQGLHTRGTLEGFRRIASEEKWLYVHGRKKWAEYYRPEMVEQQRVFFDHFLHRRDGGLADWPRVRLEVRDRFYEGSTHAAAEWPAPQTRYRTLYLDAAAGSLTEERPAAEGAAGYDSLGSGLRPHRAEFSLAFGEETMLVGHAKAVLFLSATDPEAGDLDVFVALFKKDREGTVVGFPYYAIFDDGPVAVGWQRASHRELDPDRSTDYLPVLAHRRALPLPQDGPVRLEIEILPSGTRFEAGDTLVLVVQGSDVMRYPKPDLYARHEDSVNRGEHRIHTGGQSASHLVVPVFPATSG
jgi:predicted acyl esterase